MTRSFLKPVLAGLVLSSLSLMVRAEPAPALVDAAWLKGRLGSEGLVVLDIQDRKEYARFHIPGAVNAPYELWRTAGGKTELPSMLPPVDRLEPMIAALGISNDSQVIIVPTGRGAGDLAAAARVFWTFKVLGHNAVGVLNGGLVAYAEADGRLASGIEQPVAAEFTAVLQPQMVPTADAVRDALDAGTLFVDARSQGEFVGIYTGDDKERPGTIPGSRHLPHDWVSADGSGKLRGRGALRELLTASDIDPAVPQVHFCHSGNRAALTWFVSYAVFGNENATLYDGSMMEWARRDDLPVDAKIQLCKTC
jgi:thiosulfate/3-mercaptopyruvate sulfurtransferase